jgi:hypothetical protein
MIRRAARIDANHIEIAKALTRCGAWVINTSGVGNGFPDLLIAHRGRLSMVEVKDGAKCPSARVLTTAQVQFHAMAEANNVPVHVVKSVDEALALVEGKL